MKNITCSLLIGLTLVACTSNQESADSEEIAETAEAVDTPAPSYLGKSSIIYTTASNTDLRLAETGSAAFEEMSQPLENEVSVFIKSHYTLAMRYYLECGQPKMAATLKHSENPQSITGARGG